MPIVESHAFCAATPGYDCSFGQGFGLVGDHQLRVNDQLCSQTVASRASAEVAVEGKMSRRQLAQIEACLSIPVIRGIAAFCPIVTCSGCLAQSDNAIAAPFESRFD